MWDRNVFVYLDIAINAKIPELGPGIVNSAVNFIGGYSTRSTIPHVSCNLCKEFLKKQGVKFDWIKRREFPDCKLFYISMPLMTFFTCVEINLKPFLSIQHILKNNFCQNLSTKIVTTFIIEKGSIFNDLRHNDGHDDHRYDVIRALCESYVKIRICRFLKSHNLQERNKSLRRTLMKNLHFLNQ